jgi:hypothetical protein
MKKLLLRFFALLMFSRGGVPAQLETPGTTTGVNAALTKFFGNITAFSARATVTVYGKDQKEKITTPMDFALLDNKMRVEVDTSQIKNQSMPAAGVAALKELKLDKVISVTRPDTKFTYLIFPGQQACVKMPMPREDVEAFQKNPKINKVALGKETLDGHPCVKNRVVITDDKGAKQESTVWNATDLKDFPVQIMTKEKDDTVVIRYRQIQFAKPDAATFEAPKGFKEYNDVSEFMTGLMAKALNSTAK